MSLHEWALKHGVTPQAFDELLFIMGTVDDEKFTESGKPETVVQNNVRLAASGEGWFLNRNNVGVLKDITGRPVRYGLANDTKAKHSVLNSGDLIGIKPVLITPHHVGQTIGQFASLECKAEGWHYTATEHEKAQQSWIKLILSRGGYAKFTTGKL